MADSLGSFRFYKANLSKLSQNVPVVADLIDLNYKRSSNVLEIDHNQIRVVRNSNLTLFCSSIESKILRSEKTNLEVLDLWAYYEVVLASPNWSNTKGLLFVGGFRRQPNIDAVKHFEEQILQRLKFTPWKCTLKLLEQALISP